MILRVEHTSEFAYDGLIAEAYTELRLRPLEGGGQHCSSFRLSTQPSGVRVREYRDHFANGVQHFDVLESHDRLTVTAVSEVSTPGSSAGLRQVPTPLELYDYLRPTDYAPFSGGVSEFAARHAGTAAGTERARGLMGAISAELVYDPSATDVQTRADEVLALGRGVCQDFTHVLLAACRCIGIPARYVSGYLYDPKLEGDNAASHAWVDVWDAERGWFALDPTHDRDQTESYVRVAVGRDYADVPPTRGVFKGLARETLTVRVSLQAL
ncbi:MAG TPA: transglutaminase family protein [Gaiellales bacterium]|jgi:transglutaminase-like putative cysteine protease|nr:transglutaminase family protein [Gaiellales bacterium]